MSSPSPQPPHTHDQTHGHSHDHHTASLVEANRQHFDSRAHVHGYDANPMAQIAAKKCGAAILKIVPFDENNTVVLDYACGTGLLSQVLAPYTRTLIGVDISPKSVDYYNERVSNQGIPAEEMKAVCMDLKERGADENSALESLEFDVIVCANAYHHFADVAAKTKILVSYLKPGTGVLIVIDCVQSEASESMHKDHSHLVAHKGGFSEEIIRDTLVGAAGLQDFSFEIAFKMSNDVELFIAKGVRTDA